MIILIKKYFGDWNFYKRVIFIALPLALQQLLSNAMGIVDSIMVSWIGEVTAVGTASQLENMCITVCFGAVTGIGIFASQFFGAKEYDNMKKTFGIGVIFALLCGLLWWSGITFFGRQIVSFYIQDEVVITSALRYLNIARFSYIPLCLSFTFSYFYRCMQKTYIPMFIGIGSMMSNVVLNYVLIFGHFGFPELGVEGAAWGTLCAQSISLIAYLSYAIYAKEPFIGSFSQIFGFHFDFVKPILKRTYPLVINEALYSFGSSLFIKAYGILGTNAMDSYYVGNQIGTLFIAACNGISSAASAILGSELGKNKIDRAKEYGDYFLGLAGVLAVIVTTVIFASSGFLVSLFGLADPIVHDLAIWVVRVTAVRISMRLFNVVVFASMRAGGDTKYMVFLDSGIMWLVGIPLSYFLVLVCGLKNIAVVFLLVQIEQFVRIIIGLYRHKSGIWAQNLTKEVKTA